MFQPTTFGNYFLTRRLAVGGMAEVYAAKLYGADGFEKDIVIKQILPQYARDPEFVQSFVAEAKIAVTLSHANIVGIYELGRVDGTYFIAMELVDGLDVYTMIDAARRASETVSIGMAIYIVEEVAKGLDYAHRKIGPDGKPLGLVHRDLSPRNVLISREGEVKILDFGIAKTRSEAAAMPKTRAGVVKGTSGYMSPEQATGGEVDARTDVYQAGLLLFELLTGEALFWRPDDEETRELMRRHRVLKPSELAPGVPEELDRVVLAALARDPQKRIQTAADLGTILSRYRIARYPNAGPRGLGELVARLSAEEAAQEQRALEQMPSTQELAKAITLARSPDAPAKIETIAMRTPTPAEPAHEAVPATPVRPANGTNGAHAVPVIASSAGPPVEAKTPEPLSAASAPALPASTPQLVQHATADTPLTDPPLQRGPSFATLFAAAIAAGALIGVGYVAWHGEDDPIPLNPPPVRQILSEQTAVPEISSPATATTTAAPAQAEVAQPIETPKKTILRPAKEKPAATPATVAFGTRSCSSRVTVDGQIVARSTPSYNHRLAPGSHTITIEGTSCPPIERPGSLRSAVPTVTKDVSIEAGASLKIIADFEHETMTVRD